MVVFNSGVRPLKLTSVVVVSPNTVFKVQGWRGPVTLLPRQAVQLQVVFTPGGNGEYAGALAIQASVQTPALAGKVGALKFNPVSWNQPAAGGVLPQLRIAVHGSGASQTGNGNSGGNGNGNGNNQGKVSVSIYPSSQTLQPGQTLQFSSTVTGTSNQRVTWTAGVGSITSSGLYTAPILNTASTDTVSAVSVADGSKYASAYLTIQGAGGSVGGSSGGSCMGPFSITNQEPITCVPSPNSMFSKRLPSDVLNHLMANDVSIATSSIYACNGSCTSAMIFAHSGSQNDINGVPTYYGSATDPAYVITGGSTPSSPYNALGVGFHAPNQAMTSGASSEQYFTVWDQSQNKYFAFYRYTGGSGSQQTMFPPCSSTNLNQPCNVGFSPSDTIVNSRSEARGYGVSLGNPWASNGILPPIGEVRVQELIQGHIYHALYLNTLCQQTSPTNSNAAATVFPVLVNWAALPCSKMPNATNVNQAPPGGALVFLDYTDAELALLKSYMPAWQYPIVEAMTRYGGYVGDTGQPLHPSRLENEDAYKTAGVEDPLFAWLQGQAGVNPECGVSTGQCNLPWTNFAAAGGSCPAAGLCDITQHIHIADPCIAKGLAGLSSSQGACF